MANRASVITKKEVTTRVSGVVAAGVSIGKVIVGPDGSVTIYAAGQNGTDTDSPNPCDRLLD